MVKIKSIFPTDKNEIDLVKFINTYQYLSPKDLPYFFNTTYYPKRIAKLIQNNILNANNIIDIVKVLRWAQKELLYFICGMETYLIYKLSISLTEHQFKSLSEEKGYIDFKDLIDNYNKSTDKKLDAKLSVVKNILAHGRLSDYDYNIIVDILDSSLSKLNLSSLYENYNKKLSIN